ncbi:MAG: hypothetical protein U1E37_12530 [Sphingomonadaceae bacterium]
MRKSLPILLASALLPTVARAAPGSGQEVYPATIDPGEIEAGMRYDTLRGGSDAGEDVIQLELSHGFSSSFWAGLNAEFGREPGLPREAETLGFEAVYRVGRIAGIDVAVYGEYALGLAGHSDAVEAKLLLERRKGPVDLRFNLIGEKTLVSGEKVELTYAASATYGAGEAKFGVEAFGDLGTFDHLLPRAEHYLGPVATFGIDRLGPEMQLSAGYLFALGATRESAAGQLRLAVEFAF